MAQVVALQAEDCGTCLQIGVNLARQSGVEASLLRPVIDGKWQDISKEMRDVCEFTKAVITQSGAEAELRETMRQRYGERGLIELSYSIASARIPPTVKRSLGYAKSCSMVPTRV